MSESHLNNHKRIHEDSRPSFTLGGITFFFDQYVFDPTMGKRLTNNVPTFKKGSFKFKFCDTSHELESQKGLYKSNIPCILND